MTIITKNTSKKIDSTEFIEIVDDNNRPLAVLPKDLVHRQMLKHRSVQILIFNPKKKIFLQKRTKNKSFYPNRWDVSARTHPLIGESSLDAAQRILRTKLQLEVESPQLIRSLPACPETGFEHVTIFSIPKNTQSIIPNENEVSEGYYFSREELTCLVKEFRELLTPNLVTLWEAGLLTA
ncbi:NUDIX domain-containing protein [Pseudodesulfovibrio sp. zrk46]|uniref:NUDIX hydrolase n=1 Tax=Pseudodesulfovibrio sp. zrk46 TaxID=2725288 RepID=UPI00144A1ADA|nr:NUDIX domain-containing protein [Pseudodesulfovibrio sp. zrk46]QJB57733.1 NUDIX domain-containing protein [Pseudodesulfovibrio sp. zrk46]